jgi:3-hydroxybutyryl-CoA dehydrogenase
MTRLGVVGAGTMGGGIAQVGAQQGMDVVVCDVSAELVESGLGRIRASLQRNVERGRFSQDEANAISGRIQTTTDFGQMRDADCVIEAAFESIEVKRRVFQALDEHLKDGAVLASNTSSLSITEIGASTRRPEWVVGMHFFNPVPAMALVEVIRGRSTSPEAMDRATAIARELGKTPVRCEDTPGFIVNRIVRPFYNEALRILQEGLTTHDTIDELMRDQGFRMGPFQLMDLIGNDVNFAVTESIYEGLFQEPRFRPSYVQQRLVQSGNLGQKTGRGWYDYSAGVDAAVPVPARSGESPFPGLRDSEDVAAIPARIVALIVNEAAFALMEGLATPADIDAAVKLGANYPRGPLEWGDEMGLDRVYAIIKSLQEEHGEDRYRPAPLLRKMVAAGWTGATAGHGFRTEG